MMNQQGNATLRLVRDNSNVLQYRRRGDWMLHCPNCAHVVRARTEGQMDLGYAAHYMNVHRPRITTNATIADDLRLSLAARLQELTSNGNEVA